MYQLARQMPEDLAVTRRIEDEKVKAEGKRKTEQIARKGKEKTK